MADFEIPELKEFPVIPKIQEGTMAHSKPFVAKEEFQEALGFPGELVDNWQQVAIDKMGEFLIRLHHRIQGAGNIRSPDPP